MKLTLETQFWITINLILIALIIILTINLVKKGLKSTPSRTVFMDTWIPSFDYLSRMNGFSEAVIKVFNQVIEGLKEDMGLSLRKSLTARECLLIICSHLPDQTRHKLMRLYSIYEPIRFGGRTAEERDAQEFRKILLELIKEIKQSGGGG